MVASVTYHVVGERVDGVRIVLDESLTIERAIHFCRLLALAGAFPRIQIEPDGPVNPDESDRPA
jgi:hypothetical protein